MTHRSCSCSSRRFSNTISLFYICSGLQTHSQTWKKHVFGESGIVIMTLKHPNVLLRLLPTICESIHCYLYRTSKFKQDQKSLLQAQHHCTHTHVASYASHKLIFLQFCFCTDTKEIGHSEQSNMWWAVFQCFSSLRAAHPEENLNWNSKLQIIKLPPFGPRQWRLFESIGKSGLDSVNRPKPEYIRF